MHSKEESVRYLRVHSHGARSFELRRRARALHVALLARAGQRCHCRVGDENDANSMIVRVGHNHLNRRQMWADAEWQSRNRT